MFDGHAVLQRKRRKKHDYLEDKFVKIADKSAEPIQITDTEATNAE